MSETSEVTSTNGTTRARGASRGERRDDGFLHHTVDTGAVRLHFAEARPAGLDAAASIPDDVPLVVLLHGFPEFWWSWRHQLTALSDAGYWVVAPDMRGYNESDKPVGVAEYHTEKLAADVAGLIRALGRTDAIVVGHDWGAMIAWTFAQEYPAMLRRLAILNVPHPLVMARHIRRPAQAKKSWYIFFFQLPRLPERVIAKDDFAYLRKMYGSEGFTPEEIERYVAAIGTPGTLTSAVNYYRAIGRRTLTGRIPRAHRIERPVLVIWGDRDNFLNKEMAKPPSRFVPKARVVHIPSATHWVQNAAPERVNELLADFFREDSSD